MRRIRKPFAAVASSLLLLFALGPAALAAGTAGAASPGLGGGGITAGSARTLPNSNIKGRPAHWAPSRLTAKARWPRGATSCTASKASFTISNLKKAAEKVKITGTGHFRSVSGTVPARRRAYVCITKRYKGTVHAALKDGKKLTVHF